MTNTLCNNEQFEFRASKLLLWRCCCLDDDVVRFWSRVSPPTDSGCLLWLGGTCDGGYGRVVFDGKQCRCHRVAYELANCVCVPLGLYVCHQCDNRLCVNPEHLQLGTPTDNARDREERKRANRLQGEKHPNAKLTEKQVVKIKAELNEGAIQTQLADKFHVSRETISAIRTGKRWKHVPWPEKSEL